MDECRWEQQENVRRAGKRSYAEGKLNTTSSWNVVEAELRGNNVTACCCFSSCAHSFWARFKEKRCWNSSVVAEFIFLNIHIFFNFNESKGRGYSILLWSVLPMWNSILNLDQQNAFVDCAIINHNFQSPTPPVLFSMFHCYYHKLTCNVTHT